MLQFVNCWWCVPLIFVWFFLFSISINCLGPNIMWSNIVPSICTRRSWCALPAEVLRRRDLQLRELLAALPREILKLRERSALFPGELADGVLDTKHVDSFQRQCMAMLFAGHLCIVNHCTSSISMIIYVKKMQDRKVRNSKRWWEKMLWGSWGQTAHWPHVLTWRVHAHLLVNLSAWQVNVRGCERAIFYQELQYPRVNIYI